MMSWKLDRLMKTSNFQSVDLKLHWSPNIGKILSIWKTTLLLFNWWYWTKTFQYISRYPIFQSSRFCRLEITQKFTDWTIKLEEICNKIYCENLKYPIYFMFSLAISINLIDTHFSLIQWQNCRDDFFSVLQFFNSNGLVVKLCLVIHSPL